MLPAISPSSRPPSNISSSAIRVRITVATTNRPGRRRSSRRASLTARLRRWWPRSDRSPAPAGPRRARSPGRARAAGRPRGARRAGSKLSDSVPTVAWERGANSRVPTTMPAPDHDQRLHQQRPHQHARGRADRPQQRQRAGLLQRDDQEEQAGHQRHDEREQQEDDVERPAHVGDSGRVWRPPARGSARRPASEARVDPAGRAPGRDPGGRAHPDRARQDRSRRPGWPPSSRPRSPATGRRASA